MSTKEGNRQQDQKQESTEKKEDTMPTQEIAYIVSAINAMRVRPKADTPEDFLQ